MDPLFTRYLELLLKWNRVYNLTAIEDPQEIQIKHFEDSLSPLPFLPTSCRLLDVGTGPGFPGIPLKMVRPDLEVVLLDSIHKKINFCEQVIRDLKLDKIEAIQGRAEDVEMIKKLGLFDVIITRATFSITEFLSMAKPFIKKQGIAIAMKSRDWKKEWSESCGWSLEKALDYELSSGLGKRTLVICRTH